MSSLNLKCLGNDVWVLTKDFNIINYKVPKGFVTDIDSVPRIPFIYAMFKNRAIEASILHDYLYSIGLERKIADTVYLEAMKEYKVKSIYRLPIYVAVRLFGWAFYPKTK